MIYNPSEFDTTSMTLPAIYKDTTSVYIPFFFPIIPSSAITNSERWIRVYYNSSPLSSPHVVLCRSSVVSDYTTFTGSVIQWTLIGDNWLLSSPVTANNTSNTALQHICNGSNSNYSLALSRLMSQGTYIDGHNYSFYAFWRADLDGIVSPIATTRVFIPNTYFIPQYKFYSFVIVTVIFVLLYRLIFRRLKR